MGYQSRISNWQQGRMGEKQISTPSGLILHLVVCGRILGVRWTDIYLISHKFLASDTSFLFTEVKFSFKYSSGHENWGLI